MSGPAIYFEYKRKEHAIFCIKLYSAIVMVAIIMIVTLINRMENILDLLFMLIIALPVTGFCLLTLLRYLGFLSLCLQNDNCIVLDDTQIIFPAFVRWYDVKMKIITLKYGCIKKIIIKRAAQQNKSTAPIHLEMSIYTSEGRDYTIRYDEQYSDTFFEIVSCLERYVPNIVLNEKVADLLKTNIVQGGNQASLCHDPSLLRASNNKMINSGDLVSSIDMPVRTYVYNESKFDFFASLLFLMSMFYFLPTILAIAMILHFSIRPLIRFILTVKKTNKFILFRDRITFPDLRCLYFIKHKTLEFNDIECMKITTRFVSNSTITGKLKAIYLYDKTGEKYQLNFEYNEYNIMIEIFTFLKHYVPCRMVD